MNFSEANPFSTKFWTPGQIPYQFDNELDAEMLIGKMTARMMQIVGPHGSGKSTLLQTLARHWKQQGRQIRMETLNDQNHRLPKDFVPNGISIIFLLDGFEQLPLFEQLRLRLQLHCWRWNLLLTTHQPIFGIPILYRTEPKFEIFTKLVQKLTESQTVSFDTQTLRNIYDNAKGNFRTAFFELYDKIG